MSLLYAADYKTMLPKLHSDNFEGMELIRPLYYVHEEDINRWVKSNELNFINCACRFTETMCNTNGCVENGSKRSEMKRLIKELKKTNKSVDHNIMKSTFNVNLNTLVGYTKDKEYINYLDDYDAK